MIPKAKKEAVHELWGRVIQSFSVLDLTGTHGQFAALHTASS